jgi:hypothetical protein
MKPITTTLLGMAPALLAISVTTSKLRFEDVRRQIALSATPLTYSLRRR